MRHLVALAVLIGLVAAVPAAARPTVETVTVRVGQIVPLKTVFDKKKTYTIVMSGLVTRTHTDGTKLTYDPFFGAQAENCQRVGMAFHFQIKDQHGRLLDSAATGRPSCRRDHRYEFQVNDGPLLPDLVGRATAYITTIAPTPGWTDSGSFKLRVEPEPAEPAAIVLFGVDANEKRNVVASAHLKGRGLMTAAEIKEGDLADRARLLPTAALPSGEVPELEYVREGLRLRRLVVGVTSGELIMRGARGSHEERLSLGLIVEVVASNMSACPARTKTRRGARGKVVLIHYPRGGPDRFVNAFLDLPCGVDESWSDSDVGIRVTLKKKR